MVGCACRGKKSGRNVHQRRVHTDENDGASGAGGALCAKCGALGGGYIGLEFGQMFRRYGSRVTIIHQGPQIVPREDPEIATELLRALEAEGLEFVLNARTEAVHQNDGEITLACKIGDAGREIAGSDLLVATG